MGKMVGFRQDSYSDADSSKEEGPDLTNAGGAGHEEVIEDHLQICLHPNELRTAKGPSSRKADQLAIDLLLEAGCLHLFAHFPDSVGGNSFRQFNRHHPDR